MYLYHPMKRKDETENVGIGADSTGAARNLPSTRKITGAKIDFCPGKISVLPKHFVQLKHYPQSHNSANCCYQGAFLQPKIH